MSVTVTVMGPGAGNGLAVPVKFTGAGWNMLRSVVFCFRFDLLCYYSRKMSSDLIISLTNLKIKVILHFVLCYFIFSNLGDNYHHCS